MAGAVVESVACRPPIRPPRSRRSSGWSSRGSSPRWRHSSATSGWPRSWPRTPSSTRSGSGPAEGTPRNPGAWLTTVGKRKAVDLLPPQPLARSEVRPAGPRAAGGGAGARRRRGRHRPGLVGGHRRRPPAADLRRLPPGPARRRPGGADVAPGGRPHGPRDRPGLRRAGTHHRAAHRARQEDDRQGRRPLRGARPAPT